LCVIFSALPFAGATETQNIEKNSLNQNLIQNTVGTNAVTDKDLASNLENLSGLQNWFQKQGYYTKAINGSYTPYTKKAANIFPKDAGITSDEWTKTQTYKAMQKLANDNTIVTISQSGSTAKASESKDSTSKTPVSKANAKTVTTTKLTVTETTISGWFMPTSAYDSGYAYQWYYVTWLNYDPSSGQWGVLRCNPKGADGGELTSSVTGADFDGVSGYEKAYDPRWQLRKA
jgi:N-acetylmuramoyl-L-alanine amidase